MKNSKINKKKLGDYGLIGGFDKPISIAITPDGRYAYVTNMGNGTVSVIDIGSNTIVSVIEGFTMPFRIAITPDGRYAYVTNNSYNSFRMKGAHDSVSVIDTELNRVVARIRGFHHPTSIAITPDGRYAYVTDLQYDEDSQLAAHKADYDSNVEIARDDFLIYGTVSVIDIESNRIIEKIGGFDFPTSIAITPDGRYAYVTNKPPNSPNASVSVIDIRPNIDIKANRVVARIGGFHHPTSIAITPDGRYAYVTNDAERGTVDVINIATNRVLARINGFGRSYSIAIDRDGRYAYVISGNGTVSVIDIESNRIIEKIEGFDSPSAIALTPDRRYAYVINRDNTVSVINISLIEFKKLKDMFLEELPPINPDEPINPDDLCPVCLENEIKDAEGRTWYARDLFFKCRHGMHHACYQATLKVCPICRKPKRLVPRMCLVATTSAPKLITTTPILKKKI